MRNCISSLFLSIFSLMDVMDVMDVMDSSSRLKSPIAPFASIVHHLQQIFNLSPPFICKHWSELNELTNEWTNERMNERTNEWMNEWMNEWTNEWMNEWMNEWTNEWMILRCNETLMKYLHCAIFVSIPFWKTFVLNKHLKMSPTFHCTKYK